MAVFRRHLTGTAPCCSEGIVPRVCGPEDDIVGGKRSVIPVGHLQVEKPCRKKRAQSAGEARVLPEPVDLFVETADGPVGLGRKACRRPAPRLANYKALATPRRFRGGLSGMEK